MRAAATAFWLARVVFALFALATSFYCLLAYVPFTYHHFLQFSHLGWLSAFAGHHAGLYWAAVAAVAATLSSDLRRPQTRALVRGFLAAHIGIGAVLWVHPLLPSLGNDAWSFAYALAAPLPLLWIAVIDFVGHRQRVRWVEARGGGETRLFASAVLAALFVSLIYFGMSILRDGTEEFFHGLPLLAVLLGSLASHLLLFVFAFVTASVIRALAGLFPRPVKIELCLAAIVLIFLLVLGLRDVVLAAISFRGYPAVAYAAILAASLVAFLVGLGIRLAPEASRGGGISLLLAPLAPPRLDSVASRVLWITALAALAFALTASLAANDWNFLGQEVSAVLVWAASLGGFYSLIRPRTAAGDRTPALLLASVLILGAYAGLDACRSRAGEISTSGAPLDLGAVLERYSGYDPSFRLARRILAPPHDDDAFFRFLQRNTNIPRTTAVEPVRVDLVTDLVRREGRKPNVFLFVIDSLRQDYLAPYNPAVAFTPAIAKFAAESLVLKNAFTRYGATGLSEPSIWVGGMQLHKQYVTPFHPMNALERLIETEGYQSFVSIDTILRVILRPSGDVVDLDADNSDKDFKLCRSLDRLEAALDRRSDATRPIFAYTQPQDIHVSVIQREGATVPAGEEYPGFFAPYAARVRRMDACFGEFVGYLKKRELYEESIIILTSDHGDSLGEEGRWGHAYTIFPEVLRIPLIFHLPEAMKSGLAWDPDDVAFSTDITPSLYHLLGHSPIIDDEVLGRSIFAAPGERRPRRDSYLVGSSYGPVYGLLTGDGRSLFIADAVNFEEHSYDLGAGFLGRRERITPRLQIESEKRIRELIAAIGGFYGFRPEGEAAVDR